MLTPDQIESYLKDGTPEAQEMYIQHAATAATLDALASILRGGGDGSSSSSSSSSSNDAPGYDSMNHSSSDSAIDGIVGNGMAGGELDPSMLIDGDDEILSSKEDSPQLSPPLPPLVPPSPSASSPGSLPAEVKKLAEDGAFDAIENGWGGVMADAALTWSWNQTQSLPLSSAVFQLAKEGQFAEIEDKYGSAVLEMMLGWVFFKSSEWGNLREARSKVLAPRDQRTVEHVMRSVLNKPQSNNAGALTKLCLSFPHDTFFGSGSDPSIELPALHEENAQLLGEEELLLRQLCHRGGVVMPPGRGKFDSASKRPFTGGMNRSSRVTAQSLLEKARTGKRRRRGSQDGDIPPSRRRTAYTCHTVPPLQLNMSAGIGKQTGLSSWEDMNLQTQSVPWSDIASQVCSLTPPAKYRPCTSRC